MSSYFVKNTKHEVWDGGKLIEDLSKSLLPHNAPVLQMYREHGWHVIEEANRIIIGRVASIKSSAVYIEVFESDGEDALEPLDKIVRDIRQINRYGFYRWPRDHVPAKQSSSNHTPRTKPKSRFVDIDPVFGSATVKGSMRGKLMPTFNKAAKKKRNVYLNRNAHYILKP